MPARRAAPEPIHRIRNWKPYNDALARRGSLTLWVDQATLRAWQYRGPPRRGARSRYSDAAIPCVLTLRAAHHLPPRATEGLARSIFGMMGPDPDVPDDSTPCRRAEALHTKSPE